MAGGHGHDHDCDDQFNSARNYEIAGEFLGTALIIFLASSARVSSVIHAGTSEWSSQMATYDQIGYAAATWYASLCSFETSGAHMNPVVTFSKCLRKEMGWRKGAAYIMGQLAGSTCASILHTGLSVAYAEDWSRPVNDTDLLDNFIIEPPFAGTNLPLTMVFVCEIISTVMFLLGLDIVMGGDSKPTRFSYACGRALTMFAVQVSLGPWVGSVNPAYDLPARAASSIRSWMVGAQAAAVPWSDAMWIVINLGSFMAAFPANWIYHCLLKTELFKTPETPSSLQERVEEHANAHRIQNKQHS